MCVNRKQKKIESKKRIRRRRREKTPNHIMICLCNKIQNTYQNVDDENDSQYQGGREGRERERDY